MKKQRIGILLLPLLALSGCTQYEEVTLAVDPSEVAEVTLFRVALSSSGRYEKSAVVYAPTSLSALLPPATPLWAGKYSHPSAKNYVGDTCYSEYRLYVGKVDTPCFAVSLKTADYSYYAAFESVDSSNHSSKVLFFAFRERKDFSATFSSKDLDLSPLTALADRFSGDEKVTASEEKTEDDSESNSDFLLPYQNEYR